MSQQRDLGLIFRSLQLSHKFFQFFSRLVHILKEIREHDRQYGSSGIDTEYFTKIIPNIHKHRRFWASLWQIDWRLKVAQIGVEIDVIEYKSLAAIHKYSSLCSTRRIYLAQIHSIRFSSPMLYNNGLQVIATLLIHPTFPTSRFSVIRFCPSNCRVQS